LEQIIILIINGGRGLANKLIAITLLLILFY